MVDKLFEKLSDLVQVEAIALGGSRAGESFDEKSDYDVYIYCTASVDETVRKTILAEFCDYMELSNHFWELEDNCTLKNGVDIDILYRNIDDFAADVATVVEGFNARFGYTTCMWHNLINSKIVCDKNDRFKALQNRFNIPYPERLRKNIIEKNMRLLSDNLPSYDMQIAKAVSRNDLVSINHRTAAFMESYFDVLLAYNRCTHPGEKRLVELCSKNCEKLPNDFERNINVLFGDLFSNPAKVSEDIKIMVAELKKLVGAEI